MKNSTKFTSIILAIVVAITLTVTSFATATGSIVVDNPIENTDYTAYKIFDVVYNDAGTAYSYTIDSTSEWFSTVEAYANGADSGVVLNQVNGSSVYNVVMDMDVFSAPVFADALGAAATGKTGIAMPIGEDGTAKAEGLELGYYFVTTGALCNLTTTTPSTTIHDKNDVSFTKTADDESVELGQVINYDITAKVPSTNGFQSYTYTIADTLPAGLTFNKDVTVKVGGVALGSSKYTLTTNDAGFELNIDVNDLQDSISSEILIEYSATVNDAAVATVQTNNAILTYSNNPSNTSSTSTLTASDDVYSAKVIIDKFQTGSESTKLADAKFVLYKLDADNNKLYYHVENSVVTWVTSIDEATEVVTDSNGAANFDGLENGTYYLSETAAPAGYNQLTDDLQVEIAGLSNNADTLTVTTKVANNTGSELPETGGIGTVVFYGLGALLVIGAAVLLISKKRASVTE